MDFLPVSHEGGVVAKERQKQTHREERISLSILVSKGAGGRKREGGGWWMTERYTDRERERQP